MSKNIKRICHLCNKKFFVYPSQFKKCGSKFCSKKCFYKSDIWKNNSLSKEKSYSWKGGIYIDKEYVYILKRNHPFSRANGYIAEHRLIMEKKLGRYLNELEVVHHINGIKSDNRIENLELFSNHAQHLHYFHPHLLKMTPEIRKKMSKSQKIAQRNRKRNYRGQFI